MSNFKANEQPIRKDIKLSTGRIIRHTREANGAQRATPTSGNPEMCENEWVEYCNIISKKY